MTTALTEDRLLTGEEACRYLGISKRHLADLARAGTVPSVKIGKLRRSRLESLVQWAADRERRG
jgi:excisionase family DNA binding protein